jgi:hypothetical protein
MKKYLLIALTLIAANSYSQETTSTQGTEQYCVLLISEITFSNKLSIDVDFGQERKPLKDNRMRDENTKKLKRFNSEADALNYMGQLGWKMVNAFPYIANKNSCTQYVFKKVSTIETEIK